MLLGAPRRVAWTAAIDPADPLSFGFRQGWSGFGKIVQADERIWAHSKSIGASVTRRYRCGLARVSPAEPRTMSIYTETRFLPYPPAQLFELVAAVDRYPEFLPWCRAARIRSIEKLPGAPEQTLVVADLVIGFGMIRERYRSRITLQRPQRIDVAYVEGPFRCLNSHWTFDPVAPSDERPAGGTMLTFHIEFEFRSK